MDFGQFRQMMYNEYPKSKAKVKMVLKRSDVQLLERVLLLTSPRFDKELSASLCGGFPRDEHGKFLDKELVLEHLQHRRPDKTRAAAAIIVNA